MSKQALKVRFGGRSSPGVKPINQDAFAAHLPKGSDLEFKGAAAAIADGVSNCQDSHIASQTSVTSFLQDYFCTPHSWSVSNSVSRVLTGLNSWLHRNNQQHTREQDSMLCTFSATVIKSNTLHWFHVGDSRIYLLQDGSLEQLTRDHVRLSAGRTILTRAMGGDQHLEVDYATRLLQQDDILLLSTDGIHEYLSQKQLKQILASAKDDPEKTAQELIDTALQNGSQDNLTALVVVVDQLPLETLDESHNRLLQLPIPPVLSVGNKIDDYEVLEVIFSGTRSHMYLVKDLHSAEKFVLKAPSSNFAEDPLYLDGFIREEWVGQHLDNPNVMKTYASRREKRFMYYLGEHIQGMNLRQWMDDNPNPPLDEVRSLTRQIIHGLRAFQRADMVHQDLKPENIMINQDGRVKILDFGTVKIAGVEEMNSPLDKSIPQGSVNYVAPEYLLGETGSYRSDLFSLAVIVYEMMTGKLPYSEMATNQARISSYSELNYTPALQHRKNLPLWVEGCLRKALQPNPRFRYDAFSEFLQDLTKPNQGLSDKVMRQPLIERKPVLVWQLLALALFILNLIQLNL
ncbi:bifunctional protein-serine/threonine kinase/phosphatase [Neptuniibacter sp. CAU 1671]|uniref:bifunctional protein-serine/threonine kinase/phosphatase n=1 Tax=Neptuniibacter sp. CAU 1671 TaxID=3032593 RepID=UPI0023DC2F77|nr:bifunctional protein-serine/threonine kinase/phosphatase [Neptuniibacter sp. CAU 1671]MDF2181000.1 bifunctional protein-serine/threonine kinase/phosphatase [Neptuniibacter sp. CAU 1671]